MSEEAPKGPIKLQIEVDPQSAPGHYANATMVHMTETEFVMDFIFIQPQAPKAKVATRVILSPKNAKRLSRLLSHNLKKYEERFGEIALGDPERKDFDLVH